MSNFSGSAGQDWSTVNVGRSAKAYKKPTGSEIKADMTKQARAGNVASVQRSHGAGSTNKSVAGHGMMGTTAG